MNPPCPRTLLQENSINTEPAFIPSVKAFRELELSRLKALVERDLELAMRLHAPDFHLVTPGGTCLTREEYLAHIESGRFRYLSWEPEAMRVHVFPEVAILRYRARLKMGDEQAAEQAKLFSCWHTDSYERRGTAWQVVFSQATLIRQD